MSSVSLMKAVAVGAITLGAQVSFAHSARAVDDALSLNAPKKTECKAGTRCAPRTSRLVDSVQGGEQKLQLPKNARYDATAGVFI